MVNGKVNGFNSCLMVSHEKLKFLLHVYYLVLSLKVGLLRNITFIFC